MDNRGIGFGQYQFLRTKSSVPSPVGLCPPSRRQTHTYLNRQCSNQGPPESSGGHEVPTSYGGNYAALHLGRDPFGVTDRGTYRRDQQLHSGLAQQGYPGSVRVATRSRPVLPVDPEVWGPPSGPICQRPEHSASEVFHTVSGSRSRGDQRPTVTLASRSPVRISPRESHPEGGGKDPSRGGGSDLTGAILATSPVVRGLGGAFSVTPVEDSRSDHLVEPGESETPRSSVATLDRLALERHKLKQLDLPEKVIDTMQAARRPSTSRIYQATWAAFCKFCDKDLQDPREASVITVLEFLQAGVERGLAPNTLRRQVAALATMIQTPESRPLAQHPWIRDFIKGATNKHSPPVRRFPSWDLTWVLKALTKPPFEPLRSIPIRLLSIKTAFLVAVTSARRVSELSALSVRPDLCVFYPDRVVLRLDPTFVPKEGTWIIGEIH
ncbi:uncharacterized protein [Erythrolamprus reginae]|uniref:uncharacterized protein n=1 Tax=Erythrolamprus reginae TaxID=121349 RepID=UPI00396C51DB